MSTTDYNPTAIADVDQHSLLRSTVLHLLPGVLILAFFVVAAPIAQSMGAPALIAFLLAIALVLIPFQLGLLLYLGRKRNGRFSLEGIVCYRDPMPAWQYVVLAVPCTIWLFVIPFVILSPIENALADRFFSWLPDWFFFMAQFSGNTAQYSPIALLLVLALQLIVGMIPGPLVEELYYRGYLLPRLSRLGAWAPLINTVLFSLYHFTSVWMNPSRIIAFLPLVYAVWWKKNVYLGIVVHCGLIVVNTLGMVALVLALSLGLI